MIGCGGLMFFLSIGEPPAPRPGLRLGVRRVGLKRPQPNWRWSRPSQRTPLTTKVMIFAPPSTVITTCWSVPVSTAPMSLSQLDSCLPLLSVTPSVQDNKPDMDINLANGGGTTKVLG